MKMHRCRLSLPGCSVWVAGLALTLASAWGGDRSLPRASTEPVPVVASPAAAQAALEQARQAGQGLVADLTLGQEGPLVRAPSSAPLAPGRYRLHALVASTPQDHILGEAVALRLAAGGSTNVFDLPRWFPEAGKLAPVHLDVVVDQPGVLSVAAGERREHVLADALATSGIRHLGRVRVEAAVEGLRPDACRTPFVILPERPAAPPDSPRKAFAHYMGCCPVATGPQTHHKREEPRTLRHDSADKATQRGGHVRNWDLVPQGVTLTAEQSADLEIRRAMRIGLDGFAVDAWAGDHVARASLDALFKVAEEKDYRFELTICIDPMCGGDIVESVKELLAKHGSSPKLARRNGKPLIFGYQSWIPSLKHLQRQKAGAAAEEIVRLRASPEGWEIMGQAFQDAEKQIGRPISWHYCLDAFFHRVDRKLVDADAMVRAAGVLARHVSAVGSFGYLGTNTAAIAAAAKAAGAEWSCPIGFYQKENIPYEVYAGKGLDWMWSGWQRVRETAPTLLQFSTWNDYGDLDRDGLPNWFEMYWFGRFGDLATATNVEPNAVGADGKTLLQHYLDQIDPRQDTERTRDGNR